jgi:hypothetical protein
MKRGIAILLLALIAFAGCSATRKIAEFNALVQHGAENTEAWVAARTRLRAMCQDNRTAACSPRHIKTTNSARTDDWLVEPLPPYRVIVAVHEEEIRKRHEPRVYEEFMLGSANYLAAQADDGAITAEQLERATNVTWKWMSDQFRSEATMRLNAVRAAQQADAQAWQTFNTIAAGLATVLAAGIVGAASAPPPPSVAAPTLAFPPSRTSCVAVPVRNTVTGQLMTVRVTCY